MCLRAQKHLQLSGWFCRKYNTVHTTCSIPTKISGFIMSTGIRHYIISILIPWIQWQESSVGE
jgi:hypothetical protein